MQTIKAIKESEACEYLPTACTENRWYLFCPGCYAVAQERHVGESEYCRLLFALHCFDTTIHRFNGDVLAPTLSPSLLQSRTEGEDHVPYVCHSFVVDGRIQFLGDCTHPLANQTVELLDATGFVAARNAQNARVAAENARLFAAQEAEVAQGTSEGIGE